MTTHKQSLSIQLSHNSVDEIATYNHEDYPLVTIGRYSYLAGKSTIVHTALPDCARSCIKIGNFCSIADQVDFILRGNHHPEWIATYPIAGNNDLWPEGVPKPDDLHAAGKGDIIVGNDVWIGHGVKIMPGSVINNGAVIGAGAVVAGEVPPYAIYVGNPGRVKRFRFDPEQIKYLQAIEWWNLPLETIRELIPFMASNNFEKFRARFDQLIEDVLGTRGKSAKAG